MLTNLVLWGVVLSGLTGAVVLAYRAYQWNAPTRAVLALSGTVLAACLLGYLWGSSASPFLRVAAAVGLALTGIASARFLQTFSRGMSRALPGRGARRQNP